VLDLPPGEVTVGLGKRALRLATHLSFAGLQDELRYQHDVRLSDTVLESPRRPGGVADADRRRNMEALRVLPEGVAREEEALSKPPIARPRRLYVSCDGVMYPTRYREAKEGEGRRLVYQEMKCGTVFWQEGNDTWHKRVLTSRDDVDRFGLSLWELAVRCGMLQADEVIFISDGGA